MVACHALQWSRGFKQIAEEWTDGDFHRRWPDQVKEIDHANNRVQLEAYVYPVLAALPVTTVGREQADEVMRRLPTYLSRNSRRHVGKIVARVLNLAELAGYIGRNPLPKGWVPKPGTRKDTPVLYPAEDAMLLASADVPLLYRLFYGFVHREGGRRTEAARLQWYGLDLKNGVVQLDQNKTEHARWWKMGEGVAAALRTWRMLQGWPEDTAFVFQDGENGLNIDHMSNKVQKHLKAALVSRVRLFTKGKNTLRFGTHAFRHSFTTRNRPRKD